ncbi:MAG: hypothetical protein ACTS73_06810 [Arsenophonus sp. NEOnobi-MAG3]
MLNAALSTGLVSSILIRNGYLPQQTIQTNIGNLKIKVPKIMGLQRQRNMH